MVVNLVSLPFFICCQVEFADICMYGRSLIFKFPADTASLFVCSHCQFSIRRGRKHINVGLDHYTMDITFQPSIVCTSSIGLCQSSRSVVFCIGCVGCRLY